MAIESVYCHVLGGHVTRITGLEGEIVRIICAESRGLQETAE